MSDHSAAPMIRLENVSKVFDTGRSDVHALNSVSLDIQPGSIQGIIGFSGAGKSTLVRCINLLEKPTSGRVFVEGRELTAMAEKELRGVRRKIGMIFQHFNLMRSRTVLSNVAFPLKGSGLSKAQKQEKVMQLLRLVGLEDRANAYPAQLSGGQKQRVAIARALGQRPEGAALRRGHQRPRSSDHAGHSAAAEGSRTRSWASPSSSSPTRWPWSRRSAPTWP